MVISLVRVDWGRGGGWVVFGFSSSGFGFGFFVPDFVGFFFLVNVGVFGGVALGWFSGFFGWFSSKVKAFWFGFLGGGWFLSCFLGWGGI